MKLAPHEFWQRLHPPGTLDTEPPNGFRDLYPASLPDGRQIALPIRALPGDGKSGVASLIINQASFAVEDALVDAMTRTCRAFEPHIIVGVPTLGLPLANGVARRLGHARMVALGTSRKFWYDEALSHPLSSITSPGQMRRLYLDPRMLPLLAGRRVLVVDDVISSGASMRAVLGLLAMAGVRPVGLAFAMVQTDRWRGALSEIDPGLLASVTGAIATPLLAQAPGGGWWPSARVDAAPPP